MTWCPTCASAAVYDRTVAGRTLTFGTSGEIADDALLVYDARDDRGIVRFPATPTQRPFEGTEFLLSLDTSH